MARISLGICVVLIVASSVIYEAQGIFLLKHYLKKNFPAKCNEFTPYANSGMLMLVTNLESGCPQTAEFKDFFAKFKDYMTFIQTAQATSINVDVEMKTKADGLFGAMSALSGGQGDKSADAGGFKSAMLSMGKTLLEQKKNTMMMSLALKKELAMSMVKWSRMLATFVKTASEKKGKSINISSYELDVDFNDKSIGTGASSSRGSFSSQSERSSSSERGSSSTKFESSSSNKKGAVAGAGAGSGSGAKTQSASSAKKGENTSPKKAESGGGKKEAANRSKNTSSKTKESKDESGKSFKDTTGGNLGSPSGSPTGSPSTSPSAAGKTSAKGSTSATTSSSVKQVESETSKEVMTFITDLEKKYSGKAELKVFFDKLKASMTASSTISSKTAKDYASVTRSAAGKLSDAMTFVGSRMSKSAKMKSNMETCQDKLMKTLKELQDINNKIVTEKKVTSTQQTELMQTITEWEKVTTEFVQTASSSSSSSYSSQQNSGSSQESTSSSKQNSASSRPKDARMVEKN